MEPQCRSLLVWLSIFALLFAGNTVAQDVGFSARAYGQQTFEAFVDARKVPDIYALSPPKLYISCSTADGSRREKWVQFHDKALPGGRLFSKLLPLPGDCVTWNKLLAANTDFGLGSADGPSPTIRIGQGTIGGSANDLSGPPSAPLLYSPANGAVFNHYPRTTDLVWYPVPGASSYGIEIQMGYQGQWSTWKVFHDIRNNSYRFDFVGAQPGRWRVWAIARNGQLGVSSPWWQFTYTK